VRVWHPDRFANDPRLQKIAEERLKDITEAYEALSAASSAPQAVPVEPVGPPVRPIPRRGNALNSKAWLAGLGSGALRLLLVIAAVQAISAWQAPYRAASFMHAETARIERLFGPDPHMEGSLPVPVTSKRRIKGLPADPAPSVRPSNGAELAAPRGGNGLGEFHVRNEYDLDCVIRVIDRNSPGTALRVIYVQARQEISIAGLDPGIYRVRVSFGTEWNTTLFAFAQAEDADYWIGPFEFFETQSSVERRGLRYKISVRPPAL